MKKIIIFLSIVIAVAAVILAIVVMRNRQRVVPGNIFKGTFGECDKTGYGYKGMCYGNLAVQKNDKLICERIPESESFNRKRCEDYYERFEECDKAGYGDKGTCYGNLAVDLGDELICKRISESESLNRKKCEDYYEEKVKK